jgi:hypothetical protein
VVFVLFSDCPSFSASTFTKFLPSSLGEEEGMVEGIRRAPAMYSRLPLGSSSSPSSLSKQDKRDVKSLSLTQS